LHRNLFENEKKLKPMKLWGMQHYNRRYKAFYSKDGSWLSDERNMRHTSSLPTGVVLYLKKGKYASWHIDGFKKVQTPSESIYLVQVDNNSGNQMAYENLGSIENRMLYFNSSGELLKINTL